VAEDRGELNMDILIKGMEMPKSCEECPFFDGSWCNAQPMENWRTSYFRPSKGERQESCPLIPVPEHGDLIDRDSVATALRDYLLNHFGERLDEDLSNAIYALIADSAVVLERTT
jgi:hypothetical protein